MSTCLGTLSAAHRLRQMDSIALGKLQTTSLHMAVLYRRPDCVRLLLEHGSDSTVMDGFGRAPAAVLLEHWPRVTTVPPARSHPHPHSRHSPTVPDRPNCSDTLLQLCGMQEDEEVLSSDLPPAMDRQAREMELFRQQVVTWRARSALCLAHLIQHGLRLNDVADRRRASTLLHIAARYDLVDVIEMLLRDDNGHTQNGEEGQGGGVGGGRHTQSGEEGQGGCVGGHTQSSNSGLTQTRESGKKQSTNDDLTQRGESGQTQTRKCGQLRPEPCLNCRQWLKEDVIGGSPSSHHYFLSGSRPRSSLVLGLPRRVRREVTRRIRSVVARSHERLAHRKANTVPVPTSSSLHQTPLQSGQSRQRASSQPPLSCHRLACWDGRDHVRHGLAELIQKERVEVDLEARNGTGKSPLAVAVDRGSLNAAHCLLSHGADIFALDSYGRSILHLLSERDVTFDLLMREVVRQGVDVDRADNSGNTALHVAAYMGNAGKTRFLLDKGASPDRANLAGRTPLFLALQRVHHSARDIVLILALSSATLRVEDRVGRLPSVLQREDNETVTSELRALHSTSNTLERRCVVAVRRAVGLCRLLSVADLASLPCPFLLQRVLHGQQERNLVRLLKL